MSKLKPYVVSIIVTFFVGLLGGIVTYSGMSGYSELNKPPLSPPSIVFPIVWSILYLLMSVGAARIYIKNNQKSASALIIYAAQLFFNFLWSVFFFGFELRFIAFICLIVLWLLVLSMIIAFYKIDRISALIQIPYLIWLTFAAYLNLAIFIIN